MESNGITLDKCQCIKFRGFISFKYSDQTYLQKNKPRAIMTANNVSFEMPGNMQLYQFLFTKSKKRDPYFYPNTVVSCPQNYSYPSWFWKCFIFVLKWKRSLSLFIIYVWPTVERITTVDKDRHIQCQRHFIQIFIKTGMFKIIHTLGFHCSSLSFSSR